LSLGWTTIILRDGFAQWKRLATSNLAAGIGDRRSTWLDDRRLHENFNLLFPDSTV
jgi:hypothetical protein